MTAELLAKVEGAAVYHADWRALLRVVDEAGGCDATITDAPYSELTHSGHGTQERWGTPTPPSYDGGERREINYQFWTPADVREFVEAWHPRTRGWIVSITDDTLSQVWREEYKRVGRIAFASVPYVAPGSRVRLSGDGPSCWTCQVMVADRKEQHDVCHIMVARQRTREASRWGTLPGAYVLPPGYAESMPIIGGKSTWLMRRLIEDYSRTGDLVVDPCSGGGTTAVAAMASGRRAIIGDISREHAEIAAKWIRSPGQAAPLPAKGVDPRQATLFAGGWDK